MMNHKAIATLAGAAAVAVGFLTACSGGNQAASPDTATVSSSAAAMPTSMTFIADMPAVGGETMAVVVENDKVVAYVTNGKNDEARFVGNQQDGKMELMSEYGDTLTASYDGSALTGELKMNVADAEPVAFEATPVAAPAGLYTANRGSMSAAWIVRPNGSTAGMMDLDTRGHLTVADARRANDMAFMERARQMRQERALVPAPTMLSENMSTTMDGTPMTATRMSGASPF
jgi:hypothetical protein